jgi:hypothetical protein
MLEAKIESMAQGSGWKSEDDVVGESFNMLDPNEPPKWLNKGLG